MVLTVLVRMGSTRTELQFVRLVNTLVILAPITQGALPVLPSCSETTSLATTLAPANRDTSIRTLTLSSAYHAVILA